MSKRLPIYHFPDETDFKTHPVDIYQPWCKQCGICLSVCPKGVFEILESGRTRVARPEDCTQCEMCAWHCPDYAILLDKRKPKKAKPDHS